jgi:transcriptional regulator with XRE-family HTH domain
VLRQRAGLDQIEAAKRAGIAPRTWRNMESGRRCRDETIFAISRAFQCSIDWLINAEELLRRIDQRKAVAS